MTESTSRHLLDVVPARTSPRSVTAAPATIEGRPAMRVELTDEVTINGRAGVDYVDMPTFLIIPARFRDGTIEVDILSRLNGKGPSDARAFAGIAYRIVDGGDRFEAVYLRPMNGRRINPPSPRDRRAVQYFAYPHWKFDRLREEYPDGRYEAGADIGPGEWTHLKIDIRDNDLDVWVNGIQVLTSTETLAVPTAGAVGLFVDIGTEAFFADLRLTSR